jgi:hypothetical protein
MLNSSPLSSNISNKFTERWTAKNITKKSPEMLIINFLPIDAVKNLLINNLFN